MTASQFTPANGPLFGTQTSDWEAFYEAELQEHLEVARRTHQELYQSFYDLTQCCLNSIRNGGKILFFGNGGSAADAQHLATELTVRYKANRPPIAALALTTDTSALTAIANDFSFEDLFARQIQALGNPGDVALGITTSGKSPNVTKAFLTAKQLGLKTCALSGRDGGDLVGKVDHLLIVPSHTTSRIQEMHIMLGQMLCGSLEKALGLVD